MPYHTDLTLTVLGKVAAQRARQDDKWGVRDHDPSKWLLIAMEDLGKATKNVLEMRAATAAEKAEYRTRYIKEMIETAASCVAAVECEMRIRGGCLPYG